MRMMLNRDDNDPGSGVTPYDRMAFRAEQVSRWLACGERSAELRLLFGDAAHAELTELARAAAAAELSREAPLVWIVPGIMGSQLSARREHGLPPDLLWLDALDVIVGRLIRLRLGTEPRLRASGVLLPSYLRLALRLRAAGFATRFFAYDWRLSVLRSGAAFATLLRRTARPCCVVAHSLGGLVTRAALAAERLPPIERIVMLGVPHFGSYAAVQALRGSYVVVRKLAMLDARHDAETLAARIFTSFPSLYELLPSPPLAAGADFLDDRQWPTEGPRPQATRLAAAADVQRRLAPLDARCFGIAGIGQPTICSAELSADRREFRYALGPDGDGTVPLESARGPASTGYLTTVTHSEMARDRGLCEAIVELLRTGRTRQLVPWSAAAAPGSRPHPPQAAQVVGDSALLSAARRKVDWHAMTAEQRRVFLEHLNDMTGLGALPDLS